MSPARPTSYEHSLAFLLSQTGARSAQLFAEHLAPLGVSPRAYGVLSNLAAAGSQTQQQLADALGIHRNNMVGLIDDLEAAGWARRHRNEQDRRAFDIRLTEEGARLVHQVDEAIPDVDDQVGQGLDDVERQQMVRLLAKMARTAGLRPGVHPSLRSRPR
jgi:DNA-binding MarR family transcriptional regulator